MAKEVSYSPMDSAWKVDSVEDALNELYSRQYEQEYGRPLNTTSTAWVTIGASVGLEANAQIGNNTVKNDFDHIYPWSDIISYNYDTDQKQIIAYYGEENFTFTPTGNVEVFTYIPEFYYKRYQDEEYEYIYISKYEKNGFTKSEQFSVGRYLVSGNATKVHSKSGTNPLVNTNITTFRNDTRNLGSEFGQLDYHYFILQLLYLVEYADYNSQAKLGSGYTNTTNTEPLKSGGCDILGMKSGSADGTNNSSTIYRGIEDIFGNTWQFIDGINIKDYQAYICYEQDKYQSDKYDGCYQKIGYTNANTKNGWVSKIGYDVAHPLITFPIETNGSSDTHMTDYYYSGVGNNIVLVGGLYSQDLRAGLNCWSFGGISQAAWGHTSTRLIKVG